MSRLLLIDDDAFVRNALAAFLIRAGHTVVQAEDGREGAQLFRVEPADLVITDLVMPERDGIETIIELRRAWPALPVIAISGTSAHSPFYLEAAARLGAARTLEKPFAPEALLRAVAELLAAESDPPNTR